MSDFCMKNKICTNRAVLLAVTAFFMLCNPAFAQDVPAPRALSDILPGNYHRSSFYRINDFFLEQNNYVFSIESDYGKYRVESIPLALKYLREIQIVSQVMNQSSNEIDPNQVDLQSQLSIRADSAIDILSSPLGTASNLAGQLAKNLGDTFEGNSPYIIHDSQLDEGTTADPNREIHKRNIANQVGLDVYSANELVQMMLSKLAQQRSAGKISSGSVLVTVNENYEKRAQGGRLDREIESKIRNNTSKQLLSMNISMLQDMDVAKDIGLGLLQHPAYSPSLQTRIIHYLNYLDLDDIENINDYLRLCLLANDEVNATAFHTILKLLVTYLDDFDTAGAFKLIGTSVSFVTSDTEEQLVLYPHDEFYLNEDNSVLLSTITQRAEVNKYKKIRLLTYGKISDDAKLDLLDKNIDFTEQAVFQF